MIQVTITVQGLYGIQISYALFQLETLLFTKQFQIINVRYNRVNDWSEIYVCDHVKMYVKGGDGGMEWLASVVKNILLMVVLRW